LPTRGRPGALSTVIDACRQYGCPPDLWVLVNRTDPLLVAYEKVPLPPGWRLVRVNADSIHEAVSSVLHNILGLPWVGLSMMTCCLLHRTGICVCRALSPGATWWLQMMAAGIPVGCSAPMYLAAPFWE